MGSLTQVQYQLHLPFQLVQSNSCFDHHDLHSHSLSLPPNYCNTFNDSLDISIPPGWSSFLKNGKVYFLDHTTRSVTSSHPSALMRLAADIKYPFPQSKSLPSGWEMRHSVDGIPYSADHVNKRTFWSKPGSILCKFSAFHIQLSLNYSASTKLICSIGKERVWYSCVQQEITSGLLPFPEFQFQLDVSGLHVPLTVELKDIDENISLGKCLIWCMDLYPNLPSVKECNLIATAHSESELDDWVDLQDVITLSFNAEFTYLISNNDSFTPILCFI